MPLQLRLIYGTSEHTVWSVVLGRKPSRDPLPNNVDWILDYQTLEKEGWKNAVGEVPGLRFCGVQVERTLSGKTQVLHELPGIAVGVQGFFKEQWPKWDEPVPLSHVNWPRGIDPKIQKTQSGEASRPAKPGAPPASMTGHGFFAGLIVWVRVPCLLMPFDAPDWGGHAKGDCLWMKYQMSVSGNDIQLCYAPVAGKGSPVFAETRTKFDGFENVPYYTGAESGTQHWIGYESDQPSFVERTLGVQAETSRDWSSMLLSWEGAPPRLVMRRRFVCTPFGTDPFLKVPDLSPTPGGLDITLEQRAVQSPIESAKNPPQVALKRTRGFEWSNAWAVQALKVHFEDPAKSQLKPQVNPDWPTLFAQGWQSLMATWEPHLPDKPLMLFHLRPDEKDNISASDSRKYSPFPVLEAVTQIGKSGSSSVTVDHVLVATPPLRRSAEGGEIFPGGGASAFRRCKVTGRKSSRARCRSCSAQPPTSGRNWAFMPLAMRGWRRISMRRTCWN